MRIPLRMYRYCTAIAVASLMVLIVTSCTGTTAIPSDDGTTAFTVVVTDSSPNPNIQDDNPAHSDQILSDTEKGDVTAMENDGLLYPSAPPAQPPMSAGASANLSERGLWGAHDPAIFKDPVSKEYFAYCTHRNVYRSADLITWQRSQPLNEVPDAVYTWTKSRDLWAPDILKVGDEYRMYCSSSSVGSQLSAIYLAVADNPAGPFLYRGIVVKTNQNSTVNAIDANPIIDPKTGEHYMVFGSFWSGIRLMKLDPETGLAADNSLSPDGRTTEEAMGTYLCRRPTWCGGAVEGAYIQYNPDTDYYYLFVSYGSLASDYNIRVGRSRDITGPYVDYTGRDMMDIKGTDSRTGLMLMCGYRFMKSDGWMAPGHNSVLVDEDNTWYLACHIRPYALNESVYSTMRIHRIVWSPDGWPMVMPEPYAGESLQTIPRESIPGNYEWITLTPSIPQSVLGSALCTIRDDGGMRVASYSRAQWTMTGSHTIRIDMGGGYAVDAVLMTVWDAERGKATLAFTGIRSDGVCVWAKKID